MTTVNTVELKTQANRLLKRVAKHEVVLIVRRLRTAIKELQLGKAESLKTFAKRHGLA